MKSGFIREEVVDMAHTVQATIFNRLNPPKCEHLKPLSVYSRMITCDQKTSLHYPRQLCNPFINFKIELVNNCAEKRRLDDSSPDDGYETPAKKAFSPKALATDVGCFMDYCSPPARQDSASPFTISKSALFKTQVIGSEIKETLSSQLYFERVEFGSSTEPGGNKGTVPHHLKCEKDLLNSASAFDCDVDDILCLNPFGFSTAGEFVDNVKSCKTPSSNAFLNKPVSIPTVAHIQELERGDRRVEDGREELKKEMSLNVRDVEEDKGYFSMSYIKDIKTEKEPSQSVYPQPPSATPSPLLWIGEAECHPESSSEPGCSQQAALSGQHVPFTISDLSPIVSGHHLELVNSPVEPLESDVEEVWNIGPPMFESSICQSVTLKSNAGSEQSRQVSEEVQEGMREPVEECKATRSEASLDTSYDTTLPLRVQVKSVVVAPNQHTSSSKPVAPSLPQQNTKPTKPIPKKNRGSQSAKCVNSARSQRPVIFDREADWEREKRLYVHSVTRHMNENRGGGQDVMTELLNLMTHVAEQTPGTNGRQWQHPSDLTRRNYQRRFGNVMPTMALHEWQAKNCTTLKRFAEVPKIFERSQFP